jgi:hypothetical protein
VVASRKAPVSVLPDSPVLEAERLRNGAFGLCETGDPTRCIETLDRARALDPSGDGTQPVQNARKRARERLAPPIAPSASGATLPSAVPTPPVPTATVPKSKPVSTEAPRTTPVPDPKKFGGPTKGESSF